MKILIPFLGLVFSGLIFTGHCAPGSSAWGEEIKNGLKNETGAGIIITSGNTDIKTINLSQENAYQYFSDTYKFDVHYLRSSNRGTEQALLWGLGFRYERALQARLSGFLSQSLSGDPYQGILQRYSTDAGGKYFFEKSEGLNWFLETGYRFTRENYPYGFKNLHFIRLYHELERIFDKRISAKWWIEYLPSVSEWRAYQANTELSLAVMLSEIFSIKSAYLIRYYNEPPIGVANSTDGTFTTSLVAKF